MHARVVDAAVGRKEGVRFCAARGRVALNEHQQLALLPVAPLRPRLAGVQARPTSRAGPQDLVLSVLVLVWLSPSTRRQFGSFGRRKREGKEARGPPNPALSAFVNFVNFECVNLA